MNYRKAIVTLEGVSPLSQSAYIEEQKKKDETHDQFERRIWPKRMHVDKDGHVYIPGRALKEAIDAAASLRSTPTGRHSGKETFTKFFQSGVDTVGNLVLKVKAVDVAPVEIRASSSGAKGKKATKRVTKLMPTITPWGGVIELAVFNEMIPLPEVEATIGDAGIYVGVGQYRPEMGGSNGRFRVASIEWETIGD